MWISKFKYKFMGSKHVHKSWNDAASQLVIVCFYENGFGKRKIKTMGSIYPASLNEQPAYTEAVLSWLVKHENIKAAVDE